MGATPGRRSRSPHGRSSRSGGRRPSGAHATPEGRERLRSPGASMVQRRGRPRLRHRSSHDDPRPGPTRVLVRRIARVGSGRQGSTWRSTSGATRTPRRCSWPTEASTSPAPTTSSPRCWPTVAGGSCRWDQRGHGDSEHAALYQWEADMRDAMAVLDSVTAEALPVVGHSKGGSLMTQIAASMPHRVSAVVNIDGIPSRRPMTDVQDHDRTKLLAADLADWLDRRHRAADAERRPGTIEELARRRARMNPRLDHAWLEYLVTVGATPRRRRLALEDRPEPSHSAASAVAARVVAPPPARGVGAAPRAARHRARAHGVGHRRRPTSLPTSRRGDGWSRSTGAGHFVHIEQPAAGRRPRPRAPRRPSGRGASDDAIVRRCCATTGSTSRSGSSGPGPGGRCSCSTASASKPTGIALPAPGRVARSGLRPRLHRPRRVVGPGRRRLLLRDADGRRRLRAPAPRRGDRRRPRPRRLRRAAHRRRPSRRRSVARSSSTGPACTAAGRRPRRLDLTRPPQTGETPDPVALVELAQDIRPPDYARTFAWQASALSGLDVAVAVAAVNRPPWLCRGGVAARGRSSATCRPHSARSPADLSPPVHGMQHLVEAVDPGRRGEVVALHRVAPEHAEDVGLF